MTIHKNNGFTLIELLIALVIISILITTAYPFYTQFLLKSRRTDALSLLIQDQMMMEKCYSQNFSYLKACKARPPFPQISPHGFYVIQLTNLTATTYTFTATPIGAQAHDISCASMSVNQANVRTSSTSPTECWNP